MNLLKPSELIELTGMKRPSGQAKALRHMLIDHRSRPDGTLVVFKEDLPINKPQFKSTEDEITFS